MKFHPLANLLPLMNDVALDSLAADIKANGQRDPITKYENEILDGRNRWRACIKAKVTPRFQELPKGKDPVQFVLSQLECRPPLTTTQRALAAARLANLSEGRPRKNTVPMGTVSQNEAADRFKIARGSVARATLVLKHAIPALVTAVEQKRVAVRKAAEVAAVPDGQGNLKPRPVKEQQAWLANPEKTEAKWAKSEPAEEDEPEFEEDEEEGDSKQTIWLRGLLARAEETVEMARYEDWKEFEVPLSAVNAAKQAAKAWTKLAAYLESLNGKA